MFFSAADAKKERLTRYTINVEEQENFESEKLWGKVSEAIKAQDQVRNIVFAWNPDWFTLRILAAHLMNLLI